MNEFSISLKSFNERIFQTFQSIIYYTIRSPKFSTWLSSPAIEEALQATQDRSFVDLDPIFNHNLDEDFDFRASGITRASFCSVYMDWIQFCYEKRMENDTKHSETQTLKPSSQSQSQQLDYSDGMSIEMKGISPKSSNNQTPSPRTSKSDRKDGNKQQTQVDEIVSLLIMNYCVRPFVNLHDLFPLFLESKINACFTFARTKSIGATNVGNGNAYT